MKHNTLLIKTPEGITFSLLLAGPVSRLLAWVIDAACISVICTAISIALTLFSIVSGDIAMALLIVLLFFVQIGYGMALEWFWRGQTVGKRVLHLRVVDAQGLRLQLSQVVIRNLLRFVDSLPMLYLVGGLACLLSRHAQRLGDFAANTVVVRSPEISLPDLDQILAGKFNSLRAYPHLEARLRQRVSPQEAAVPLQAILRREQFDPQARVELFRELADRFRALVPFPPDVTEGITDEQYLRNIVDTIYRPRNADRKNGDPPSCSHPTGRAARLSKSE